MIYLEIPGEPVAKGRPRVAQGIVYTPPKTLNYETLIKELFIISRQALMTGELRAEIDAYFTINKTVSQKKKEQMINQQIRPTKRPDLDNVAKAVLDALNGLAYNDDSQIVSLTINKYWAEVPRVTIKIEEVRYENLYERL